MSGITFIRYDHNQNIGEPNNINVFGSKKSKGSKRDGQNRHKWQREENLRFNYNYMKNNLCFVRLNVENIALCFEMCK